MIRPPAYCEIHGTFHPEDCATIDELRAHAVPIHRGQLRMDVDEIDAGPKVLCAACLTSCRVADLDQDGRCGSCAPRPSLEDLLAESLRQRGVTP